MHSYPDIHAMDSLSYVAPRKDQFPSESISWRDGLYDILSRTEKNVENDAIILVKNAKFVCTYDMFPKAKFHLLLMCRNYAANRSCLMNVKTLNDLTKEHLDELREFHNFAKSIAAALISRDNSTTFRIGYHSIPSMHPLHLHIISSDLDSPCITRRKHVVSFTTRFFVTTDEVENHLESSFVESLSMTIRTQRAQDVLDSTPLECQYCARAAINLPDFKRHNQICLKSQTCPKANTAHTKMEQTEDIQYNSLLGWASWGNNLMQNSTLSGKKRLRDDNTNLPTIVPHRSPLRSNKQH